MKSSVAMGLRRTCMSLRRRRVCVALAVVLAALWMCAACGCGCGVRVPATSRLSARLPARPARLAHLLADYNNQIHSHIGSWVIEEESSNYTSWSYSVRLECGLRCDGSARVSLWEGAVRDEARGAALRHGALVGEHHVRVEVRRCLHLTPLGWPQCCDETETEMIVVSDAVEGWSQLREQSVAWCDALGWLTGACHTNLNKARQDHLMHLNRLLNRL